jgi:hypothetical protein
VSDTTADHLAWEAKRRPLAGAAAILAGLLTIVAGALRIQAFKDFPSSGFAQSLERAAAPGQLSGLPSLKTSQFQYIDDHAVGVLGSSVLVAVSYLAMGVALAYLARATAARRPEFPSAAVYLPYLGAGISAVGAVLFGYGNIGAARTFLDGPHTVDAARDAGSNGLILAGQVIQGLAGALALGAATALVALNAMRAGLLTRFMGVLGIIVAVLTVIPLSGSLPIVQVFWLLALGALILGFWPSGVPPAWRTGEAVPWPTSAEIREARRTELERRRDEPSRPEPVVEEEEPVEVHAGRPHPSSKKRKRKRRHP